MKKISWIAVLIVALAWAGLGVSAQTVNLERIPSPDQIKNFKVMERVGNALYGIRLESLTAVTGQTGATSAKPILNDRAPVQSASGQVLNKANAAEEVEKIIAPHLIPLYDKIRQVGNSLWGVRKEAVSDQSAEAADRNNLKIDEKREVSPTANLRPRPAILSGQTAACVIYAIEAKDLSLNDRALTLANELRELISARSLCQKAALTTSVNQRAELEICLKVFKTKHQSLNERQRQVHQEIWARYQSNLKTCQTQSNGLEEGTEIIVDDGSDNLMGSIINISLD